MNKTAPFKRVLLLSLALSGVAQADQTVLIGLAGPLTGPSARNWPLTRPTPSTRKSMARP